jgi:SAM-dependent methyltransferase
MMNHYRYLARYFDRIFASHVSWLDPVREGVLGPVLPRIASSCDLACGTGRTAMMLARRGIRTCGVDLSAEMCRLTRIKARRAKLPIPVIRADMRDFRLAEPVDLILCEFDAINHVPSKDDLARVAKCVSRALRSGGYFYFDANTRLSFRKLWPSTWFVEKPGVVMVMHGGYDPARDIAWTDVEWFLREGTLWRRRREHVEEVCWSASEVRHTLLATNFHAVQSWDVSEFIPNDPIAIPGSRTIYLARKEK